MKSKQLKTLMIKLLIVFVIASFSGLSTMYGYEHLVTYFFAPLLLLIGVSLNNFRVPSLRNIYAKAFLVIIIWAFLLVLKSHDTQVAITNCLQLGGVLVLILLTIEIVNYKKYNFVFIFLISFVISFFIMAGYLIYGIKGITLNADYQYRGNYNFDLNENTYSYLSYFANIALFYLIQISGRKRIYIFLSIITLLLGIYVSFITASRSGLLFTTLIGGIYWIFIFKKLTPKNLIPIIIIVIALGITSSLVYTVYNKSYLKQRVNDSIEFGDLRSVLVKEALNAFTNHPLTGLGPGQFQLSSADHQFSHNAFTEIAVNMGIIGLLLLLFILFRPLILRMKKIFLLRKLSVHKLDILFFLSFILMNTIYVFYEFAPAMSLFFLIIEMKKRYLYKVR